MELRHLRYFRVVAEELHYGRAAARLHMEPQPLNFQIKQLERQLGFALFDHREKRTTLTAAGAAFLGDVESILAAAHRAVEHGAMVARGESGSLRIGYSGPLVHMFLARAIREFRGRYPAVSFDLEMVAPAVVVERLNRRELDLGFSILPVPNENFNGLTLMQPRFVAAVASSDPLAVQQRATWAEFRDRALISVRQRFPLFQESVDRLLGENDLKLAIAQEAADMETALAFVAAGIGILFLPDAEVWRRHDLAFVELPEHAEAAAYGVIWRRSDTHPLRERFVEAVVALAETDASRRVLT